MIALVVRSTLDQEFRKIMEKQKNYFGEKYYEPVRQELIKLVKMYL